MARRMMYNLTLEGQGQNLTSGQGKLTRALMGSGELHVLMGGGGPKGPPPYLQK